MRTAHLDSYTGTILEQNVNRLLSGGIVEDRVVEGGVTKTVAHRHTGSSLQQDLHDVAELSRLGGGLGKQGGPVNILDIKLDVGMITQEGFQETFVSETTDFLQFLLYWTESWVDYLPMRISVFFVFHPILPTFGTTSGIIVELFGQKSTSSLSSSSPRWSTRTTLVNSSYS